MENYFNYFTEIEECFRRCRATPSLLSTLDWALIEAWKEAGIPLQAVLGGIERSFEKFQKRPQRFRKVNSVAYCTQEVLRAAGEMKTAANESGQGGETSDPIAPFSPQEIAAFLESNASALERASQQAHLSSQAVLAQDLSEAAAAVREAARQYPDHVQDLRELENHLSAIEEKTTASLTRAAPVERLAALRRECERGMARYRQTMAAAQIESLERQFLKKRLFEHFQIPRLSLFYL